MFSSDTTSPVIINPKMDETRVEKKLLCKGKPFLARKYPAKVLLRRKMCEIFERPIH